MLLFFVDLSRLALCYFSFPIAFRLSQLTAITGGKFKLMSSSGIVYPYLSTPIGKLFLVSIYLFCFLQISREKPIFSVMLCLATTITVLKPVSCDHVTSFNYDDKKARDVGLTCWCHLSNNMPDSIFHESMRKGITCVCVLFVCVCACVCVCVCGVILLVFLRMRKMESVLSLKHQWAWGNLKL